MELYALIQFSLLVASAFGWNKYMENAGAYQGDMDLTPEQMAAMKKGEFSYGSVTYGRWPNGVVPYYVESSIGDRGRRAIDAAIADYHKFTCLRFHKRRGETNYISFYKGPGCLSPVGMNRGYKNRVSLASGCWDKGTVLHEIGHSLGLFHEQSRPDRDKFVNIHYGNIQKGLAYAFDIQRNIDSLGTPYDLNSMMHYSSIAFAKYRGQKTITTKDSSKQHIIDTYNRISGFSPIDIKQINLMYKCDGVNPPIPTSGPQTQPPSNCKNYHRRCQEWANRGECKKNPRYMLRWCRLSCKVC